MKLFLVRHGETVDNVAGNYAGVTDSPLTSHGALQARRLAAHLSPLPIAHFFSSDLQRAFRTAEAVRLAQARPPSCTLVVAGLREQDFGVWEGRSYVAGKVGVAVRPAAGEVESRDSMKARAAAFVAEYLLPLMGTDDAVVVVSHGIFLSYLWRSILGRFEAKDVVVASGVVDRGLGLDRLGGWSNTGYLELEIKPKSVTQRLVSNDKVPSDLKADPVPENLSKDKASTSINDPTFIAPPISTSSELPMTLHIKAVNSVSHLSGLKKTRGGIGSAKHDNSQSTIENFFKKRRLN